MGTNESDQLPLSSVAIPHRRALDPAPILNHLPSRAADRPSEATGLAPSGCLPISMAAHPAIRALNLSALLDRSNFQLYSLESQS
ncbi:hypothetical protein IEQ34_000570 [Dendrobium chrysotoxum]|uniref:Uncharacterized protein n=1 Tax=Dendrobium chrysotoxum TaxID=161865 RepID=A0AAV7HPZ4_DENCH|nr:hypothetical protein IEQ34_000570 [Dendrobium chrysotoxum]